MHFDGPHQCPRCTTCCNVEDYAEQPVGDDALIAYLYCESCNSGFEIYFRRKGRGLSFEFQAEYDWKQPRGLAKLLRNLEAARQATSEHDAPETQEGDLAAA
jgi:hypothetical protein